MNTQQFYSWNQRFVTILFELCDLLEKTQQSDVSINEHADSLLLLPLLEEYSERGWIALKVAI